jgi:hypothetical protein
MTNFKLNDVVIITKNPPNQIVKIKGDVGYIDEFQEATNEKGEVIKYVYFKTIKLNSFLGGMGSVPIDCIELCDNPIYLKRFQEIIEHQKKENDRYENERLDRIMTKEKLKNILKELKDLKSQKSLIDSKISNLNEKLLPYSYSIEEEDVDLEHLGFYTNYFYVSKENKAIGKNHQTYEDAILDAWEKHTGKTIE